MSRTTTNTPEAAERYGILTSAASTQVYPDLVDSAYSKKDALKRISAIKAGGLQAILVRRVEGQWLDRYGRTPQQVLNDWLGKFHGPGPMPELSAAPATYEKAA